VCNKVIFSARAADPGAESALGRFFLRCASAAPVLALTTRGPFLLDSHEIYTDVMLQTGLRVMVF
jgi:hypothetical protein